jgi:outer membrane receptor protein involved in Fe transport
MRHSVSLILASVSVAALLPGAALAQTASSAPVDATPSTQEDQTPPGDSSDLTNAAGQPTSTSDIVVTGSRVRRSNFNTASPVDIITRDDRVLAGSRSTGEVLQSASVTSGTSQVNGSFLGFVSEGGPAADTVGLRGLSSSRTLVLLNGRRLAPAGVGPQLVSADLNVLPTSMVQRIEVLREGASSVYGSDAIAGVVNVITDTKLNGIVLDAFTDQPTQHGGGGRTYRTSLSAGKVFDRGHITASVEYRQRTGLRVGDREKFSCPRDLFFDPATGKEVGQLNSDTGQLECFPYALGTGTGTASGYGIAAAFIKPPSRITFDKGDINTLRAVNGLTRVNFNRQQLEDHVISPVKTYTGYLNGAYELGTLGDAELYGEALFTRRTSHQDASYQLNIDPTQLSPLIEIYGGSYAGTPLSVYGYPTSPFFPNSLANADYVQYTPFIMPDRPYVSSQKVDFFRANAGLRGTLGIGDWRYDGNVQVSRTKARNNITLINSNNLSNALRTELAPAGTPQENITRAIAGQAGAGKNYTCATNVNASGQFIAGSTCVPLNMYDPSITIGGHIPDNVYDYLFDDNIGHTTFRQTTFALNLDGTLFTLPAGAVRGAIGFEHRSDYINDIPSEAAQNGTLYNYSSAGITKGKDKVNEVYGEISIPLIKEKPFFYDLQLDASARYTHYRSYGSDVTYHLNGQWAPAEFLRFRGNYGTSFRAPNLYEQYVADQTGFFPGSSDPCNGFGQQDPSTNVYKNCLAELTPILGAAAVNYIATAGPQVTTRGGAGLLKAEHSTSYGFGAVLTMPREVADLSLAIDYFHIKVKDEVAVLYTTILSRCYEADDFPNNAYCDLIDPRRPATDPQKGTLASFLNPYLNVSAQSVEGIDFDMRYATGVFGGRFVAQGKATRMLHQRYKLFAEEESFDYNGTLGVQGFGAGPKWVANLDLRFTTSDDMTFRWGVSYVGPQDSTDLAGQAVAPLGLGKVNTDLRAEHYWNHGASIQWRWKNIGQFTIGVNNIFNANPPVISNFPTSAGQYTRIGNYFNSSNYDLLGRSVFFNVTRQF